MAEPERPIHVRSRRPGLTLDPRRVVRALRILEAHFAELAPRGAPPLPSGELSVVFLRDAELASLHARFLGDPSPTDVITFPGDSLLGAAGEICVSADAAVRSAGRGRAFSQELALYVVHGWLHLAGHDDRGPQKKRAMRRAEARALRFLREASALPSFDLHRP